MPRALPPPSDAPTRAEAVLRWLVPLRFLAAGGQVVSIELARSVLALPLPYDRLWWVPVATIVSNTMLGGLARRNRDRAASWVLPTLVLDVGLLTLLLQWSGGPDSPVSALYVIPIALAAMTGNRRATWVVALASAACYGLVFVRPWPAHFWHAPLVAGSGIGMHALGMWGSVLVVAVVITFFMTRIVETLTEREAEMRRLAEIAARNARLASLTTLAAGAAHELGSPLGTIAVVARELERTSQKLGPDAKGLAEDAQLLRAEVERCRDILDRMRARAAHELESGSPALDVQAFQTALLAAFDPSERARIRMTHSVPAGRPLGSRFDLLEVVAPILENALDASAPADPVDVSLLLDAGRLRVVVRDRGTGMDATTLEHVGEPFFTTRPPGRGTGLGLFVVNLHLERLGGTLQFDSTPGEGTTAVVEWPVGNLPSGDVPSGGSPSDEWPPGEASLGAERA